jgi:hypothetical protein
MALTYVGGRKQEMALKTEKTLKTRNATSRAIKMYFLKFFKISRLILIKNLKHEKNESPSICWCRARGKF